MTKANQTKTKMENLARELQKVSSDYGIRLSLILTSAPLRTTRSYGSVDTLIHLKTSFSQACMLQEDSKRLATCVEEAQEEVRVNHLMTCKCIVNSTPFHSSARSCK